ncbi:MAG: alanine racemase [Chloroflexi bacterium]|nr:alanine racemase [Chloroflexota bacterium]
MLKPNGKHAQDAIERRFTTSVVVDLDAIAHNVRTLNAHIGPDSAIIAVVKDDAYGHGAVPVARTVLAAGATRLAVGRTDEGIQLRRAGITAPILNLCYTVPGEAEDIVAADLTASVGSIESARALSAAAGRLGKTVTVHLKIDTGMGRYGLLPPEVVPFLKEAAALPHLDWEGVFTHFATADGTDKSYTQCQYESLLMTLDEAAEAGFRFRVRHASNSAAVLDLPEMALDAVRPGIALFGLYPSAEVTREVALRPAMTLKSHVARLKVLPEGSGIGYGLTYRTPTDSAIALVPVGYGDGYQRILSNRGAVLIGGQRAPIVGRVCMDQFMVDATGIEGIAEGSEVVLIGEQDGSAIPPEEIAAWANTINYEVVTGVSRRIPRIYTSGGEVAAITRLA